MPFPNRTYSDLSFSDLRVGDRVQVLNPCVDFKFFRTEGPESYGTVVRNSGRYLGVIVQFDVTFRTEVDPKLNGGEPYYDWNEHNFNPTDLQIIASAVPVYVEQDFEEE
jgi:hypothetical protein